MARGAALSHPFPAFAPVRRLRPVGLVQPGTTVPRAPAAAAERALAAGRPGEASLRSGADVLAATWDGDVVALEVEAGGRCTRHVSRRHGCPPRAAGPPTALAVTLTGPFAAAFTREDGAWTARAVLDLADRPGAPDVHDEGWLAGLAGDGDEVGAFGQLGLRDVRVVTHADGTPYLEPDGGVLFSATSAGPGGFRTGHTSVWALDPDRLEVAHRADLFVRRTGATGGVGDVGGGAVGVYGDHAGHLVRDGDEWLVATSTWGDFDKRRHPRVTTTLARTTADVTRGSHVLDAGAWPLPTEGLGSVGTWDPHLVRDPDAGWLVAFVSATRFFRFHPAVATGPSLDRLTLRAAATDRTATEGPTLARAGDRWWLLGSDGRDNPRRHRAAYPVWDLDLRPRGTLDAAYPSNLPWPTLVDLPSGPLLLGFDGRTAGGPLLGYGTHGDLVLQRPDPSPWG